MMKKLHSLLYLMLLILLYGCANPNEAKIYGKVSEASWEGKDISLYVYQHETLKVVATAKIEDGKFDFKLLPDTPFVATLRIDIGNLPYLLPVGVEPGLIKVLVGKETLVSGTPLNERLQQFMLDKDDFAPADSLSDEGKMAAIKAFFEKQIEANKDCPVLANFIRQAYGGR